MNDFSVGLLILCLIVVIAFLGTGIVYLRATISRLNDEIVELKNMVNELVDSSSNKPDH